MIFLPFWISVFERIINKPLVFPARSLFFCVCEIQIMESAGAEVHLGLQTSQENYPNFCNEIQIRWLWPSSCQGDRPGAVNTSSSLKPGNPWRSVARRAQGISMSLVQWSSFRLCWRLYLVTPDCLYVHFPSNNLKVAQSNRSTNDGHCY